ncbi:MAG TPA: hypothetical protein VFX49_02805 [Chloroflexota bacterium]|nr:hypothetical protein [Chloroflexota bacterium]
MEVNSLTGAAAGAGTGCIGLAHQAQAQNQHARLGRLEEEVRRLTRERDALLELRDRSETEVHELRALLQCCELWFANLTNAGFVERRGGFAAAVAEAYARVHARHRAHANAMIERLTGRAVGSG